MNKYELYVGDHCVGVATAPNAIEALADFLAENDGFDGLEVRVYPAMA